MIRLKSYILYEYCFILTHLENIVTIPIYLTDNTLLPHLFHCKIANLVFLIKFEFNRKYILNYVQISCINELGFKCITASH